MLAGAGPGPAEEGMILPHHPRIPSELFLRHIRHRSVIGRVLTMCGASDFCKFRNESYLTARSSAVAIAVVYSRRMLAFV